MPDALDLALANAASNMPKGEELHLENLDSIADPTGNEPALTGDPFIDFAKEQAFTLGEARQKLFPRVQANPDPEYQKQKMAELMAYTPVPIESELLSRINAVFAKVDLVNTRLDALADMVSEVSTTITTAASMSQEPNLKHRSLHEWDDSQLLNELVERENDLMPFYFELLKRIPRELQPHVDESMKGKYQSLGVLSKLCAALSYVQQPQQQEYVINGNFNDTHLNAPNYAQAQQMSDIIQQLNQPSADDLARTNRNPDKYGSPTYPQSDNQPTILNEYRAVPKLPFVNGMVNPYPQS